MLVFVADLVSKTIVVATLSDRAPVRLLGGLLTLRELRNSGAAFSIGTSVTVVFTLIALGVIVAILRTARRLRSVPWAVTLGLLLGGAAGNLGDRLFRSPGFLRGHVVDWIELPHWPVFNVADSCIVCGGVLAVLLAARGIPIDGARNAAQATGSGPGRPACARPARGRPPVSGADQRRVPVPEGLDGERLDAALARMFGLSRTSAAELITGGQVLIGGRPAAKSDRVPAGEWLDVTLPAPVSTAPVPRPVPGLDVVYEDSDIVVVDKPPGVAAHPTPGWTGPTVLEGLLGAGQILATSGAAERQGIVHRLDANTSGLMVVAKSEHAYRVLKQAFRDREVDKRYHALVQGHPDPLRGTIDAPTGRHPAGDGRFAVVAGGRPSVTHYDTLEAFRGASLEEIILETGRTHQIRVHMAALRHPCAGDRLYGADPVLAAHLGLTRQWLHAVRLGFAHPADGRRVEFTSEYSPDLAHALGILRAES